MYVILKESQTAATIKSWLPYFEVDSGTYEQVVNAAQHPDVGPSVALMPDAHVGFGVPIGCVFPTVNAIVPNAVGVDIGCGVSAFNTNIIFDQDTMGEEFWHKWAKIVRSTIPTGFSVHRDAQELGDLAIDLRAKELQPLMETKVATQLGTLGGGNHFLEAQVDEEGFIWVMVHSGSRHTGLRIAGHYHALAKEESRKRGLKVVEDLSSLLLHEKDGADYCHDMQWAARFAEASRYLMLTKMHLALEEVIGDYVSVLKYIDCSHNFAAFEEHDGINQIVHRKGATNAQLGQLGIIPGSMGTNSFIVKGKGSSDSMESCSHGAGRTMGRGAAKRKITEDDFKYALQGTFSQVSMGYVDEAPQAYKDINTVMIRQSDLVDIVYTLSPLMTVKGDSKAKDD